MGAVVAQCPKPLRGQHRHRAPAEKMPMRSDPVGRGDSIRMAVEVSKPARQARPCDRRLSQTRSNTPACPTFNHQFALRTNQFPPALILTFARG